MIMDGALDSVEGKREEGRVVGSTVPFAPGLIRIRFSPVELST